MPEVTLRIGPKSYTVACGAGEEEKIARLGAMIAERYDRLGAARAPLEAQNLVFAALFMADEMAELTARAEQASANAEEQQAALTNAKSEQQSKLEAAHTVLESEKAKWASKKEEFESEIETLRKAEARAREELKKAKAELADLREAQAHQHDLFGSETDHDAIAETLERLAMRAEAAAEALESAELEETGSNP